eukprot:426800-Hanusia_phi.AAC.1
MASASKNSRCFSLDQADRLPPPPPSSPSAKGAERAEKGWEGERRSEGYRAATAWSTEREGGMEGGRQAGAR